MKIPSGKKTLVLSLSLCGKISFAIVPYIAKNLKQIIEMMYAKNIGQIIFQSHIIELGN